MVTREKKNSTERIFQVPVHAVDYETVLAQIGLWIKEQRRPSAYVIQTNVFSLVTAAEISSYREVLGHADYSLPDGMPLVWLLNLKGHGINERIYGPDMMLRICEEAAKSEWRCFLYGGKENTLKLLKKSLVQRFPSLNIVGTYSPPFRAMTKEEDNEICGIINAAKPDIVWVGLGAPKQEIWMYEHKDKLDVSVLHGVGAAFDFISGQISQAPRWMMKAGMEWFFRLCTEPRRLWKRYTIMNIKFLFYLCSSALNRKNEKMK
jgi:N-acetylglucosaminyldiphosphoundecaprenol N-acetyl-beta-D-mannosaminyltransferase